MDQLSNIEAVIGTNSSDTIIGNSSDNSIDGLGGNNSLVGGDGADTLVGTYGNDTFVGGLGNDSFDGGGGTNTADYSGDPGSVYVDLSTNYGADGYGSTDTLLNIQNVIGSASDDTVFGNDQNNTIAGGQATIVSTAAMAPTRPITARISPGFP